MVTLDPGSKRMGSEQRLRYRFSSAKANSSAEFSIMESCQVGLLSLFTLILFFWTLDEFLVTPKVLYSTNSPAKWIAQLQSAICRETSNGLLAVDIFSMSNIQEISHIFNKSKIGSRTKYDQQLLPQIMH